MDRYNAIVDLRAVRTFAERSVSEEHKHAILEAARWTGSAKNDQRWSFVVIDDPDQMERLCDAGAFTTPIRNAPLVICLVQESGGYEFDTGRLAQNIMLAADAIGVASCPVTLHREAVAREVLGVPDSVQCTYAVALGYPTPIDSAPKPTGGRKPLDEIVHSNRYGG